MTESRKLILEFRSDSRIARSWPKSLNLVVDIRDYVHKLNINETQEFSSIESLKLLILNKITFMLMEPLDFGITPIYPCSSKKCVLTDQNSYFWKECEPKIIKLARGRMIPRRRPRRR